MWPPADRLRWLLGVSVADVPSSTAQQIFASLHRGMISGTGLMAWLRAVYCGLKGPHDTRRGQRFANAWESAFTVGCWVRYECPREPRNWPMMGRRRFRYVGLVPFMVARQIRRSIGIRPGTQAARRLDLACMAIWNWVRPGVRLWGVVLRRLGMRPRAV